MKMLTLALTISVFLSASAPALAAPEMSTAPTELQIKKNQVLVDAEGRVLGKVYEVNSSRGMVTFTVQMKMYRVPLASVSMDGARLKTSMTKAQLGI
ncbi:MAG: hypothetical protein V4530_05120 [Pseudomonadota bacterium]